MTKELSVILDNIDLLGLPADAVKKVEAFMPEMYRASRSFGRKNSQTTARLMTLNMLTASSPYRVLRQCLAEIEKRKAAIQEAVFSLRIDEAQANEYRHEGSKINKIRAEHLELRIAEAQKGIVGALKDIATFQDAYGQVVASNDIRPNWDEADFESAEVTHHVRTAFLHAYRDIMAGGRLGMGTLEYLEQFGIHPQSALKEATSYYQSVEDAGVDTVDAGHLHNWLDDMAIKYADHHYSILKKMGIKSTAVPWLQYRED